MATKSKMSTSVTRKVTKKTTPPPVNPIPTAEETEAQYEQRLKNWSNLKSENDNYSKTLADYNAKAKLYKQENPGGGYIKWANTSGTRALSDAEIKKYNEYQSKKAKGEGRPYLPITKGSRIEKGVSINLKTGDYTGKFNKDPFTGRELDWSESGRNVTVFEQPQYERLGSAPAKPQTLGRKPLNTKYDPKMKIKPAQQFQVKKMNQEPEKIIKPKLTTEVPVAIEKPTKKPVPKSKKTFVVTRGTGRFRSNLGKKITGKRMTKGPIETIGFVGGDKKAKQAAKAANKSTRAARMSFGREERLAAGYLKNQGIIEGENKKEIKSNLKSYRKYAPGAAIKEIFGKDKLMAGSRMKAISNARKAAKYVGLAEKGKLKSFTPEALAKKKTVAAKVQTTEVGKGKNKKVIPIAVVPTANAKKRQAGRNVY
jgi:hypothetical protein